MNKYMRIILYALVIWWMAIVFCFSHQEAVQSSATSHQAIEMILSVLDVTDLEFSEKQEIIKNLQLPIRKLAHFTLYFIGGAILYLLLSTTRYSTKVKVGISLLVATVYAISDEFHQAFVPGRSAQITDVCIDSLGALAGIMTIVLITIIIDNRKKECK